MSANQNLNQHTENKSTIGETLQHAVEKAKEVWDSTTTTLSEKSEIAVEKVKEWAGMEIIDDVDRIKQRANKMNPEQAHMKDEMQKELTGNYKEHEAIPTKPEYKEQVDVKEHAELLNREQAHIKEEMQKELKKENKEIPAFDNKSTMDKVIENFDSTNMNEAMGKAKEVWENTTGVIADKTEAAVDKVKEWTGIENPNDPEYVKSKLSKQNPEQAQMKQEMQRELTQQHKAESPIQFKKEDTKDLQSQRKQQMQKELIKENKAVPAFDEKVTAAEKMKETWDKTTSKIAEKGEMAVDKVKEWTGAKDSKETVQEIKDKAVKKNPEQAQMKQKMQRELTDQNKKQSPVPIKNKDVKTKERQFASEREKKMYEDQVKASY